MSKNAHLRRTSMYALFLGICPRFAWTSHPSGGSAVSEALPMDFFRQPLKSRSFTVLSVNQLASNTDAISKVSLRGVPRFAGRPNNLGMKDEIAGPRGLAVTIVGILRKLASCLRIGFNLGLSIHEDHPHADQGEG
jgi:hypothetical protein